MNTRTEQVTRTGTAAPLRFEEHERTRAFSPGAIIEVVLGVVLLFIGAVALFKTGVDSDVTKPTTTVFGITQSAGVAMIEVVAGLLLIVSAFDVASLVVPGVLGVLAIAVGLPAAFASDELQYDLGFGQSTGWFFVFWGTIAIVGALLPVVWQRKREIDVID